MSSVWHAYGRHHCKSQNFPNPKKTMVIATTMESVRSPAISTRNLDEPTVLALANLSGTPLQTGKLPTAKKAKVVLTALDWIRKSNPSPNDVRG
jgi:hypothetical protein